MSGGMRSVAVASDLNDQTVVPTEQREVGMLAYVESNNTTYQLQSDLVTWVPFSGAGGGSNFVRRGFQNATSVTLYNVLDYPVTEVYFEDGFQIQQPYIHNLEDGVYGEVTYNQFNVEGLCQNQDLTQTEVQLCYIAALNQLFIQFDQPRTGIAVAGF
jgi:hypothetical protein